MNRSQIIAILLGGAVISLSAALANIAGSGGFELTLSNFDGGGGASSGGSFDVAGGVGQPDSTQPLTGGGFDVAGGFVPPTSSGAVFCTADLDYPGLTVSSRCIRFEFFTCPNAIPLTVDQEISFTAGHAFGVSIALPENSGPFSCITARDRLHTLQRTALLAQSDSTTFADFTGARSLTGGNLNGDGSIDILDFGIFIGQFGATLPAAACGSSGLHADIDGDGTVFLDDFSFININFLRQSDPTCCSNAPMSPPVVTISVDELWSRGLGAATAADLNHDGKVDMMDIAAFLNGAQPQPLAIFQCVRRGDWFSPANWSTGELPDAQTDVAIVSSANINRQRAAARDIDVRPGGSLHLFDSTLNAESLYVAAHATLEVHGGHALLSVKSLRLDPDATLNWSGGVIEINGSIFSPKQIDMLIGTAVATPAAAR